MDKKLAIHKSILICLLLYSCSNNESLSEKQIGRYKVDFYISDTNFTKKEKSIYSNSELELKDNGTYVFYGYRPENHSSRGEWKIIRNDRKPKLRLYDCCSYDESDLCNSKNCLITISVPCYEENIISGRRKMVYRKYK